MGRATGVASILWVPIHKLTLSGFILWLSGICTCTVPSYIWWWWSLKREAEKKQRPQTKEGLWRRANIDRCWCRDCRRIESFVSLTFVFHKVIVIHHYQCPQQQSAFGPFWLIYKFLLFLTLPRRKAWGEEEGARVNNFPQFLSDYDRG